MSNSNSWVVVSDNGFELYVADEFNYGVVGKEVSLEVAKGIASIGSVDCGCVAYPNVSEARKFVESLLK